MTLPEPFQLEPAQEADFAPLFDVIEAAQAPQRFRGAWDGANEKREFRASFAPKSDQKLMQKGNIAGLFGVRKSRAGWFLMHFALHPAIQNRGIGSILLKNLTDSATRARVPVELTVWNENPAYGLYHAHGFRPVLATDTKTRMRYSL